MSVHISKNKRFNKLLYWNAVFNVRLVKKSAFFFAAAAEHNSRSRKLQQKRFKMSLIVGAINVHINKKHKIEIIQQVFI